MSRRILVLSASVGAGHTRAAEAVEAALRRLDPAAEVQNLDVLKLTNGAFRRLYGAAYLDLVNKAPHMLGVFYDMLDKPRSRHQKSDRLRRLVERLNLQRLLRILKKDSWDVVVNTHFLPAEMIASLRRHEKIVTPQITVTTDFESHRLWVNQPCDHYFAATGESAEYLHHWGVPLENITVSGIPVHPDFSTPPDRAETLRALGLDTRDGPVVLQLGGGFGVGPVEKLHQALLSMPRPLRIVTVTGKNEKLRQRLDALPRPPHHAVQVLGFRRDMPALMAMADVVVTKPGGLTTSEALACGAALVIVNPIPGQESRNSDFLLENGAGIKINSVATLAHKLGALLENPARLSNLKANARRAGRPHAATEIARRALDWPGLADH